MESFAAFGTGTLQRESANVGIRVLPGPEPPDQGSSESFDEQLAKAELAFWDEQKGSAQPGLTNLAAEITYTLSGLKRLQLAMDQEKQQVVVRVLDKQTNNVVRQLPSRQMVDLVKQMRDLEGVLFKASS
ncbi:MAG: flagellar protein FlaG [Magnetococcus sp. YQC-3]